MSYQLKLLFNIICLSFAAKNNNSKMGLRGKLYVNCDIRRSSIANNNHYNRTAIFPISLGVFNLKGIAVLLVLVFALSSLQGCSRIRGSGIIDKMVDYFTLADSRETSSKSNKVSLNKKSPIVKDSGSVVNKVGGLSKSKVSTATKNKNPLNDFSSSKQTSFNQIISFESTSKACKISPSSANSVWPVSIYGVTGSSFLTVYNNGLICLFSYDSSRLNYFNSVALGKLLSDPIATDFNSKLNRLAIGQLGRVVVFELIIPDKIKSSTKFKSHLSHDPWIMDNLRGRVGALEFSPSGKSLLLTRLDNRVYHWRFDERQKIQRSWSNQELEQYLGHGSLVGALAYHPFGKVFFTGDWDGGLVVWQRYDADEYQGHYDRNLLFNRTFVNLPNSVVRQRNPGDPIEKLAVSHDGLWLMAGFGSGNLELWMIRGLKMVSFLEFHQGSVVDIQFSKDGRSGVSLGQDGRLLHWDIVDKNVDAKNSSTNEVKIDLRLKSEFKEYGLKSFVLLDEPKNPGVIVGMASGSFQGANSASEIKFVPFSSFQEIKKGE